MNTSFSQRDNETWFDQRPSHPARPQELIDADQARNAAWLHADEVIEERLACKATVEKVDKAVNDALAAEQWYRDLYRTWQSSQDQDDRAELRGWAQGA